jgi:hypothetical protein
MVNRSGSNFFKNPYVSTAILFFCINTACNTSTTEKPNGAAASNEKEWQQADNLLHQRLQAVQEADNRYTELLTVGTTTAQQDEESGRIAQAEIALQQSIDSLERRYANAAKNADLARLLQFFRASLQNRQAASDLRMALSAESEDSVSMQQTVVQLRADLRERDRRIATLEQESRSVNRSQSIAEKSVKETAPGSFAPANGESLADLKQRNKNLLLELNNVQNKYFIIGRNYLLLKQEHERTIKELAALRKPGSGGNQP